MTSFLITLTAATLLASPDQGELGVAASQPNVAEESACTPLLRIWREEAKELGSSRITAYERLVEEACARYRLRPPEGFEARYRASLRRVLSQYGPYLGASNDRTADGVIRWLAWCTLEACDRKEIPADKHEALTNGYSAIYAEILAKAKTHLLAGPGPGLSETSSKLIEDHLKQSAAAFERRIRNLESDFLYPALKAPLTTSRRAAVIATYDNARLYPAWGEQGSVAATAEQLHLLRSVALLGQIGDLVQFDILAEETKTRLLNTKWWGRVLREADSTDGEWPGVFALYLPNFPPASCPTTRKVRK